MDTQLISGIIIENTHSLTLEEFSQATKTSKEIIVKMVEYQLIYPEGETPEEWRFDSISLKRGRTASSFYHTLEVNMHGVVLALKLLDKIEDLQKQVDILERFMDKPQPTKE